MSEAPASTEAGLGAAKGGARSGAFNPLTIIAIVVAVGALAFSGFMLMQLGQVKQKLASVEVPDGLKEEAGHEHDEHGNHGMDDSPEPQEVVYELGEFTANSSDMKFVKMNLALVVRSYYAKQDWDNYQIQLQQYEDQRELYFQYQRDAVEGAGAKGKGHGALPPGSRLVALLSAAAPAQASAPKKEPAPPTLPEAPPARPLTRMEAKLKQNDAKLRNIIITQINSHTGAEMISTAGKEDFKQKVMEAINSSFDSALGQVVDIYFRDLVTT